VAGLAVVEYIAVMAVAAAASVVSAVAASQQFVPVEFVHTAAATVERPDLAATRQVESAAR
jgi:hypothetical protein